VLLGGRFVALDLEFAAFEVRPVNENNIFLLFKVEVEKNRLKRIHGREIDVDAQKKRMAEEQERWEAEQKQHKAVEALKKTIEKGTGLPEYEEDVYASAAENGFGWSHANYDVVRFSLLTWVRITK
jgi:hypothetical protein